MPGHALDRPRYLAGDLDLETLYRMLLEVASELSVTRDRLLLTETLLQRHGLVDDARLEAVAFEPEVSARLEDERRLLVSRLAACVQDAPAGEAR